MVFENLIDFYAFAWFLLMWVGYTFYSSAGPRNEDSIASIMFKCRADWVKAVMRRELRIADITLVNGMTQLATFLASTTILVLAGAITALSSSEEVLNLLSGHTFIVDTTKEQVQFKLLILVLIFVFAFFRLTWSMRQYIFCGTLLATVPFIKRKKLRKAEEEFAALTAKICNRAAREFNYGLRAYYFALAFISWFISPWIMMFASTIVVLVLYRREFRSLTVKDLLKSQKSLERIYIDEESD